MDRHELHGGGLLHRVHVGKQRRVGQIPLQGHKLAGLCLIVIERLLQLRQVVQPVLLAGQAQHGLIAGIGQNTAEQIRQIHALVDGPVLFDHPGVLHRPAPAEQIRLQIFQQSLIQAQLPHGGVVLEIADAGAAHPPAGLVDRPQEGHVVSRSHHPQVAQHVLDLLALVELHAGVEHIGDLLPDKGLLNGPGHMMRPVEHRNLVGRQAFRRQLLHLLRHPAGLFLLGLGVVVEGLFLPLPDCRQLLLHALAVVGNQGVGRRQNLRRGAVVGVQNDGLRPGMLTLKLQDKIHVGAPPGVDGLVRVAHHEQVLVVAGQNLRQLVEILVDVLELVHHDVLQPPLPLLPDRPVLL